MIGYVLMDSEGNYVSMTGGETKDWFKASKFDHDGIKSRTMYLKCGYELYSFEISIPQKAQPKACGEFCDSKMGIAIQQDGIFAECEKCKHKTVVVKGVE